MICGAEDLIGVCKEKIADKAHDVSADGKFSWEEVECLGSCSNAPMVQIGKDYYEDLTAEKFAWILDELAAGRVPTPGPQNGRYAAEPLGGLTSLGEFDSGKTKYNASAQLASDIGDTVKRIDGTEVPLITPWVKSEKSAAKTSAPKAKAAAKPKAAPKSDEKATVAAKKPRTMKAPRKAGADDLKLIKGVGPKLEKLLNTLGFYHFDQIAKWSAEELSWVDENLEGFKGRASRDEWVSQASVLAKGEMTEFSSRFSKGDVY
jgi:NADH-quinone oxidoreductase subunit E